MFASDFIRLYSLLNEFKELRWEEVTPEKIGKLQAEARVCKIALDICVIPYIKNVEILNEISIGKQGENADGKAGGNGVSV